MDGNQDSSHELAEKVAAILAKSSLEPGIYEMNQLMKITAEARQLESMYTDMFPPVVVTQTTHSSV